VPSAAKKTRSEKQEAPGNFTEQGEMWEDVRFKDASVGEGGGSQLKRRRKY